MQPQKSSRSLFSLLCLLLLLPITADPQSPPQISPTDRIRLAEAFRVAGALGDRIWPGWSKAPFAVLLITPDHEFLVRHPNPTKDFTLVGHDALLNSDVYFRKRVFQPNLLATFPAVGGVSTIVIGQPEHTDARTSTPWVITLLHEHFHQLQDSQPDFYSAVGALGLARNDESGMWMLNFPFPYDKPDVAKQFAALSVALAAALDARKPGEFRRQLALYKNELEKFRELLANDDYKYFSFQLWKEGVARYTEYRVAELASRAYRPGNDFAVLKDATTFADRASALKQGILSELRQPSLTGRRRVSFYAFGAAEAMLLDRANPTWKQRYFKEKFSLEKFFN